MVRPYGRGNAILMCSTSRHAISSTTLGYEPLCEDS